MSQNTADCQRCHPACAALLLVRPSLVSNDQALGVPGAAGVRCDPALLGGCVPARAPSRSRHVLRLLRAGYVHVYLPQPPQGMKPWLVYRITEEADVYPDSDPVFTQHPAPARCSRSGHNLGGMKLVQIPRAGEIQRVWIAYSANLWSQALRERNAADPRVMQEVALAGGSANTFAPTAAALQTQLLECAVTMPPERAAQLVFRFNTLASQTQHLVDTLRRAAATDARTRGHEQVVVLRDFAGLAADANALRLRRHALAAPELDKPENKHPLRSAELLQTLRQTVVDGELGRVHDQLERHLGNNVMSRGQFDAYERTINPLAYGHGAPYWVPLPPTRENIVRHGADKGLRIVPGQREAQIAYAQRCADRTWAKMESDYYSEPRRRQWLADFERRMHALHGQHVEQYEADWWAVREAPGFHDYFARHFDAHEPNTPHALHCPGATYTAEVERALTPAPFSHGAVLDAYLAEIEREPADTRALLWRALVCNQGELLPALDTLARAKDDAPVSFFGAAQVATANQSEPNPLAHLRSERPDKLFDLVKGALDLSHGTSTPNAAQRAIARYGWLSAALGDAALAGAFAIVASLSQAAAAAALVRAAQWGLNSAAGQALATRVLNASLAQRALDFALRSVTQGVALDTPLVIRVSYPLNEARIRLWRERGATVSLRHLERVTHERLVTVNLLTSAGELARFGGDVDRAVSEGGGHVTLGTAATPLPRTITREAFEALWHRREALRAGAAALGTLSAAGANHSFTLVRTLDGRLAVGAVMVNLYGLNKSLAELTREAAPGQGKDNLGAVLGVMDAAAGTLAGAAEVMIVLQSSRLRAAGGEAAVSSSPSLPWMRFAGGVLGAVGGFLCAASSVRRMLAAGNSGQTTVAVMYGVTTVAFAGTGVTGGLTAYSILADALLKSQMKSAAARSTVKLVGEAALQSAAGRFAVGGAASVLGLTVPGLGWILLGVAVGFEVWAVMNTATPLQVWVARSYFGTGVGTDADHPKFKPGDWEREEAALVELFTGRKDQS